MYIEKSNLNKIKETYVNVHDGIIIKKILLLNVLSELKHMNKITTMTCVYKKFSYNIYFDKNCYSAQITAFPKSIEKKCPYAHFFNLETYKPYLAKYAKSLYHIHNGYTLYLGFECQGPTDVHITYNKFNGILIDYTIDEARSFKSIKFMQHEMEKLIDNILHFL
jgi:hypothetical protein